MKALCLLLVTVIFSLGAYAMRTVDVGRLALD